MNISDVLEDTFSDKLISLITNDYFPNHVILKKLLKKVSSMIGLVRGLERTITWVISNDYFPITLYLSICCLESLFSLP